MYRIADGCPGEDRDGGAPASGINVSSGANHQPEAQAREVDVAPAQHVFPSLARRASVGCGGMFFDKLVAREENVPLRCVLTLY